MILNLQHIKDSLDAIDKYHTPYDLNVIRLEIGRAHV